MPQQQAEVSIEAGWREYLAHAGRDESTGGVSAKSAQRYRAVRDKHLKFCQQVGLIEWINFTAQRAYAYAGWLNERKLAPRTKHFELTTLKSVVKYLKKRRLLPTSFEFDVDSPRPCGSDRYCFTSEQVAAMIEHCRTTKEIAWMADVLSCLAFSGLRIGELASLTPADIVLDEQGIPATIRLTDDRARPQAGDGQSGRRLKGRRGRFIPIHPTLVEMIQRRLAVAGDHLFKGPRGGRLKPDTVLSIFKRKVQKPLVDRFPAAPGQRGFADGVIHSFRHFFVSECFRAGTPEADIKSWIGHQDSKVTELYRHLNEAASRERMAQIDFFGSQSAGNGSR